jgi:hypothetical protein
MKASCFSVRSANSRQTGNELLKHMNKKCTRRGLDIVATGVSTNGIPVYSFITVVEDDGMYQESSRLLSGIRNVLLVSLKDKQKTWKRRTS